MENWEKQVLQDLVRFIVEEEEKRFEMVEKLSEMGVTVPKSGTGRLALERIGKNVTRPAIECEDSVWWLNVFEFIQPYYNKR